MLEIGKILSFKTFAKVFLACFCVFQVVSGFVPVQTLQAASAPNIINYQGRVLNANGIPVSDSSLNMIFELYTAVSGGSCVWSNSSASCASATARAVTLTDGLFSEGLGDTGETYAAISDAIFGNNASLFLQITVAGEVLTPRKQIAAAPYALNSDTLDGLDADTDGATSSAIVALNSSGNAVFTGDPTGATVSTGVVYVNPAAAAADETIIGIGDNGSDRFRVDKEGDVFIKTIELDGAGSNATTSGAFLIGVFDEFDNSSGTTVQGVLNDLDAAIVASGSKWTDGGTFTYLTSITDDLVVGAATVAAASLFFDESVGQLDLGTDDALGGALRLYSSGVGIADVTLASDASGNLDLTAVELTLTGDVEVTGGDFTSASATFNFLDSASSSSTIDIGGVTANQGNTVNIATNSTVADAITIGNANASSTVAITGGNDWSVDAAGTGTFTDLVCTDCLNFAELSDTLTVDDHTTVALGTKNLTFNVTDADLTVDLLTSSGFNINDNGGSFVQFQAAGSVFITPAVNTTESFLIRTTAATTGDIFALDVNDLGLTLADYIHVDHTATYASAVTVSGNAEQLSRAIVNNSGGALAITGDMLSITSNNSNSSGTLTDSADLLSLTQSNTAATGYGINMTHDGTGHAISVTNSSSGSALKILQAGDTGATVDSSTGGSLHISDTANDDYSFTIYNNTGGTANTPLSLIFNDHVGFDQDMVRIVNDSNTLTSSSLVLTQNVVDDATTAATSQALVINVNEAASNDEVILILSDADGTPDAEFRFENDGDIYGDGATYNTGADYAEFFYTVDNSLGDHEIVCQDLANNFAVKTCDLADPTVIGVISTSPGFVGNNIPGAEGSLEENPNYRIVGLEGQIDTYVTAADGAISVGDALTASSVAAGFAGKATSAGRVVGFALEPLASGNGLIKVRVSPGWDAGEILTASGELTSVGTTLALESLSTATALSPVSDSHGLAFRGSVWNGTSAQALAMTVANKVTSASNYRLSVANDSGAEVAYINNLGDLVLSGKLYPSNQGTAQTSAYIYYDNSGVGYMRTNAAGWGTGSYDFAEMFPSPEPLQAGDVVVFGDGDQQVKKSTGETYDDRIAGVVSTRPGFLAGNSKPGDSPIALSGRVPTRVNTENGAITIGDPLTTSSTPGVAMKATEPGPIVGYALQPLAEGEASLVVFIRASYFDGNGSHVPQLVSAPVSQIANAGNLTSLTLSGGAITSVGAISGLGNSWRLTELGDLRTYGRVIQLVKSHQNEDVETYATASRQMTIELSGTATLSGNSATVRFEDIDPQFNDIISTTAPYRVLATPGGVTGQIYVIDRTGLGFTIQSQNTANGVLVDWMVIAPHKDYEPEESVPDAENTQEPVIEEPIVDPIILPEPEVAGESVEEPAPVQIIPEVVTEEVPPIEVLDPVLEEPVIVAEPELEPVPALEPDPVIEPASEAVVGP